MPEAKILIADDKQRVHEQASRALKDFQLLHAYNPEEAKQIINEQQRVYGSTKPIDLLISDINMPSDDPTGIELMTWFHETFPNIPIICHSDDRRQAEKVPFTIFVEKAYDSDDRFSADEAFLRAAVLDIFSGKHSFDEEIKKARELGLRDSIDDLKLPKILTRYVGYAKKPTPGGYDINAIFVFARAGYIDKKILVEILRYVGVS